MHTISLSKSQTKWPVSLATSDTNEHTIYDAYPYLFLPVYSVNEPQVQKLVAATRLFANAIFQYDSLIDQDATGTNVELQNTKLAMQTIALQFEAYKNLHDLFPLEDSFWDKFKQNLISFIDAIILEKKFQTKVTDVRSYNKETACKIAIGKASVARTIIAALSSLADTHSANDTLIKSIDLYNFARQMYDDLIDWKADYISKTPSLILINATNGNLDLPIKTIQKNIYFEGHANDILNLALSSLAESHKLVNSEPLTKWKKVLSDFSLKCKNLQSDINQIANRKLEHLIKAKEIDLVKPKIDSIWVENLLWPGLNFLIKEWKRGWGEARHVMKFKHELGFTSQNELVSGDIFQRALIACTLQEVNQLFDGQLDSIINHEAKYLIEQRDIHSLLGWKYFPSLPELPPDVDDLAQIMQLFSLLKQEKWIDFYCTNSLKLIQQSMLEKKSFETWLIPDSNLSLEQEGQKKFTKNAWGRGADPDVIANLAYALYLYDPKSYQLLIKQAIDYLLTQQSDNGSWESTWYHGPYYGTYLNIRILQLIRPSAKQFQKAKQFIINTQNQDGGWGINPGKSDDLSTAFSLLCLSGNEQEIALRGYRYLEGRPRSATPFILMDQDRTSETTQFGTLTYSSKTITTNFVVKAALHCHQLFAQCHEAMEVS